MPDENPSEESARLREENTTLEAENKRLQSMIAAIRLRFGDAAVNEALLSAFQPEEPQCVHPGNIADIDMAGVYARENAVVARLRAKGLVTSPTG